MTARPPIPLKPEMRLALQILIESANAARENWQQRSSAVQTYVNLCADSIGLEKGEFSFDLSTLTFAPVQPSAAPTAEPEPEAQPTE